MSGEILPHTQQLCDGACISDCRGTLPLIIVLEEILESLPPMMQSKWLLRYFIRMSMKWQGRMDQFSAQ